MENLIYGIRFFKQAQIPVENSKGGRDGGEFPKNLGMQDAEDFQEPKALLWVLKLLCFYIWQ